MSLAGCLRIHREYMERHVYQRIFVSVNYHYTNPNKCIGMVQSWHYDHHLIKILLVLTMILLQYYSCRANRQSLTHLPSPDDSKGKHFGASIIVRILLDTTLCDKVCRNIVENGIKHHKPKTKPTFKRDLISRNTMPIFL